MTIDQKALEAADKAWRASVAPTSKLMLTAAIKAYLAALPASDHAGLVEKLRSRADELDNTSARTGYPKMELILDAAAYDLREAATALSARVRVKDQALVACRVAWPQFDAFGCESKTKRLSEMEAALSALSDASVVSENTNAP